MPVTPSTKVPWERRLIAFLALGAIPATLMVWYRMHQSTGFASLELIVFPLVFGGAGILATLLVQVRYLHQSPRQLSPGLGRWVTDVAWGLALTGVLFALFFLERAILAGLLVYRPNLELLGLMLDLREHPWMVVVWFGPVLWVGIALFEELLRVFLLTQAWSFSPSPIWALAGIVLVAAMTGLVHWSQGPYGMVTIGIQSLVIGAWFYRYRRLGPLVLAHVLYDGLQIAMLLATYPPSNGTPVN